MKKIENVEVQIAALNDSVKEDRHQNREETQEQMDKINNEMQEIFLRFHLQNQEMQVI